MAFVPYATSDELLAWAQIPGLAKAAQVDLVLDATSRAVDEWCQRHFWQDGTVGVPVARTFVPCDRWRLDLGPFNDLSTVVVPAVATDEAGDGTFETTWLASDYQLVPVNRPTGRPYRKVEAIAGRPFPVRYGTGRLDRVRVTGVWGWDAVPAEVKQATLIKATRLLTRMQSANGIAGVDAFGPIRVSRAEDGDVVALLDPYRHPATVLVA
jgi:hypothetical protein